MARQFSILCQENTLRKAWITIKAKGSAGGIDGFSVADFEREKHRFLAELVEDLKTRQWKPFPYLEIEIPKEKDPKEKRKLGMVAIRDKIVQQAIRGILEPRLEKIFMGNSYGYRPGKGPTKAIRRLLAEIRNNKKLQYVLRLDIDNFFDTIDHDILQKRLIAAGTDVEIVRLIMLCMKMGKVKKNSLKWIESEYGTPQGAILSPLLSNLYLNSFDQFANSHGLPYVRYADDFVFLCETEEEAVELLAKTEKHLKEKLKLSLNQPTRVGKLADGFDFLGITISNGQATVTEQKREDLNKRILGLEFDINGLTPKSKKTWDGFCNYYGQLLPEKELVDFDTCLMKRLQSVIHEQADLYPSKSSFQNALSSIDFLSKSFCEDKKKHITELVADYMMLHTKDTQEVNEKLNKKIIQERKKEFRQLESEGSGLLVNRPGAFVGLTNRGITVSYKGKVVSQQHVSNITQIIITGKGVSLSSNLISHCLTNKVPIDFFDHHGIHMGSIMTSRWTETSLWYKQAMADISLRNTISLNILEGKIKNQFGLLKYFHKYHKLHFPNLQTKIDIVNAKVESFKAFKKQIAIDNADFMTLLLGHESQVAIAYWDYIREMLVDDDIGFEKREHRGATDLMNSMLNYGYAILYVRVWQALLAAHLNPFESIIHVRQPHKPTLVYDVVEIFRSQVVDRIVISLIQKGQDIEVKDGLLTDDTRKLLVKSIMERLARYETWQGKEMTMEQIIKLQAKMLAKSFETKEKFKPYVAKW